MSEDWDVYCIDCAEHHGCCNANYQDQLMLELIAHRDILAALAKAVTASTELDRRGIELRCGAEYVNPAWFLEHAGHHLVARSEYGNVIDPKANREWRTGLEQLNDNWNGEGSPKPNQQAIEMTQAIVDWSTLRQLRIEHIDPDALGGVSIYMRSSNEKRRAWICCLNNGSQTVVLEPAHFPLRPHDSNALECVALFLKLSQ